MFEALELITTEIQKGLEGDGKQTILNQKLEVDKIGSLPAIAIYDTGFSFEKTGIGEAMGVTREETREEFNGDGIRRKFKLKNSALRPIISVEVPAGNKLHETSEFTVDYPKNEVTFRVAPPKAQRGKSNILITYAMAKSSGEIKGIRLRIHCNFDIWAKNSAQCDRLVRGIVRSMLFAEDDLAFKGIHLTPLGGTTIRSTEGGKVKEIYARRLIYRVETDVLFTNKVSRIEKIEIGQK